MSDILKEIADNKRCEINAFYKSENLRKFVIEKAKTYESKTVIPLSQKIRINHNQGLPSIIAEFKRKSPSKGNIAPNADVKEYVRIYEKGKAAACSILTDTRFFGGACTDLSLAREVVDLPLLRKDFIIDEIQISEAKILGGNVILLIASLLTKDEIVKFTDLAHSLRLEVLFEIHGVDEIEKIYPEVDMIGVNNRKLATFNTDVNHSLEVMDKLPKGKIYVAESGIKNKEDIRNLYSVGYQAFLIGETLMKSDDPIVTLENLRNVH